MAVLTSRIRVGFVLPLLIATIVLMLVGHQAIASTWPAEGAFTVTHVAESDGDRTGISPMHSTICCPATALAPVVVDFCFDALLGLVSPIDLGPGATDLARPSKLFRPPRAA